MTALFLLPPVAAAIRAGPGPWVRAALILGALLVARALVIRYLTGR